MIKAGIKEALQSGQLNSWWWISQPLDLFVFCGSSLSPPSTTPLSPPHPPYFSHPDYSISKSILPLLPLRASHNSQTFPPATVPGCPSHLCREPRHVGNGHLDRRGHRTFGKTMEKREAAKQWWPATRVCHSCTRSTLQGVGRANPATRVSNGCAEVWV